MYSSCPSCDSRGPGLNFPVYRDRIDISSLQQSQRFNSLDSSTKDIMKAILNTKNDIIGAVAMSQATGLHYATGNAGFSYSLISSPCVTCR